MNELLPWQAGVWARLTERENQPHAYLLHGPQGIGKRVLAEQFMAYLLCRTPHNQQACGQCRSCQLLAAGSHPDHWVMQAEAEDKAIRVDQVRELVSFVAQTAQLGGRKVVLIEPAEAMNLNAANALLKSLEEPAGDTVLLLLSHAPSRLLATLRSRCVQQTCPVPTRREGLTWLTAQMPEIDAAQLNAVWVLSGGLPLRAKILLEQGALAHHDQVIEGLKQILKQQVTASQLAEQWKSIPLILVLEWLFYWSQAVLKRQLGAPVEVAPEMEKVVEYLAERAQPQTVAQLQNDVIKRRDQLLAKANLNPQLLLEALLIQWAALRSRQH